MIKNILGARVYVRGGKENLPAPEIIEEAIVEDPLLHEHEDGTIHSHEGGNLPHDHEENLDEEVQDNDVSDSADSSSGADSGLWNN